MVVVDQNPPALVLVWIVAWERLVFGPLPDDPDVQRPGEDKRHDQAQTPPVLDYTEQDYGCEGEERAQAVQEGGDFRARLGFELENPFAGAVDADVGVGVGDADVDNDGFVGLVNAAKIVDCGGVCDAGDGSCMEICDFRERGVGACLAEGFSCLLVVQAGGENKNI